MSGVRTKLLNEKAFDAPLSAEAMYWLGWLATDGSVVYNGEGTWIISLKLSPKDRHIVEAFKEFLGSTHTLGEAQDGKDIRLQFTSTYMATRLAELGIVPNKTLKLKVTDEVATSSEFWLGAIEGDGSVSLVTHTKPYGEYEYLTLQLVGASKPFQEQFVTYLESISPDVKPAIGLKPKSTHSKNPCYQTQIRGSKAYRVIQKMLSKSKVTPLLNRKWDVFRTSTSPIDKVARKDQIFTLRSQGETFASIAQKVNLSISQTKQLARSGG